MSELRGGERPALALCSSCGTPLGSEGARGEERKLVSVLFVDLVGFTSRSDRADPEDVRDALRLYHAEAKRRIVDYAEHLHLHADATYWTGRYDRCAELSREARSLAADIHNPEALLRGGGTEALALAGLGRHEEAIQIWDELFVVARELGRSTAGLLNYSSLAYRELLDLEEARTRSEEALELSAGRTFGMPSAFASSDLLFTDLLADEVGRAQAAWPALWGERSQGDRVDELAHLRSSRRSTRADRPPRRDSRVGDHVGAEGDRNRAPDATPQARGPLADLACETGARAAASHDGHPM